MKYYY